MGISFLFLTLPLWGQGAPLQPELTGFTEDSITISWTTVPDATAYVIYRLPFLTKRRDAKPRLFDKRFILQYEPEAVYTDIQPMDITLRATDHVDYIITFVGPDGITESSYRAAYFNRLTLEKPVANFTHAAPRYCAESPITFTDSSTGLAARWYWTDPEGDLGQGETLSYAFPEGGNYDVTLTAKSPIGESSRTDTVIIHALPIPTITGEPYACISSTLSTDPDKENYQWSKDGIPVPEATQATYEAAEPGIYTVAYTDENDCTGASEPFAFDFFASPTCGFTLSMQQAEAGEPISAYQESTGEQLTYLWDLGNGQTMTEAEPAIVYGRPGTYTLALTVTDLCGNTATCTEDVTITTGTFTSFPPSGTSAGGTEITLTGNAFPESPTVTIDGQAAPIHASSSTSITVEAPSHSGGLDSYTIAVHDATDDLLTHELTDAYRYVTMGFVALPSLNAVQTLDLNSYTLYPWPVEEGTPSALLPIHGQSFPIQHPTALLLSPDERYLYLGAYEAIYRIDTASGAVTGEFAIPAGARALSLAYHDTYLTAGVTLPGTPSTYIEALDPATLDHLAYGSICHDDQTLTADQAIIGDRLYLLTFGPEASDPNNTHKSRLTLNVFDLAAPPDMTDGEAYLHILAGKSAGELTTETIVEASLAYEPSSNLLYVSAPHDERIFKFDVSSNTFSGVSLKTTGYAPEHLLGTTAGGIPALATTFHGLPLLRFYDSPTNGQNGELATTDLSAAGCLEIQDLVTFRLLDAILCDPAAQVLLFDPALYQTTATISLDGSSPLGTLAVQER